MSNHLQRRRPNPAGQIGAVAAGLHDQQATQQVRGRGVNVTTRGTVVGRPRIKSSLGTVPRGGIILWSGQEDDIPAGWALCDGTTVNGYQTPNLVGRFVIGSSGDPLDLSWGQPGDLSTGGTTVGDTGGTADLRHTHTGAAGSGTGNLATTGADITGPGTLSTSGTGASSDLNGVYPPYYVLAYIMRIR